MSGVFAQRNSYAGPIDTVPAIEAKISSTQINRYLHVIYAVGRQGFLNVGQILFVEIVRQSTSLLIATEILVFPSIKIAKTPGRGSYNMVIFAISDSPQINWVNFDKNPAPTEYSFIRSISKNEIDAFISQPGGEDKVFKVSF